MIWSLQTIRQPSVRVKSETLQIIPHHVPSWRRTSRAVCCRCYAAADDLFGLAGRWKTRHQGTGRGQVAPGRPMKRRITTERPVKDIVWLYKGKLFSRMNVLSLNCENTGGLIWCYCYGCGPQDRAQERSKLSTEQGYCCTKLHGFDSSSGLLLLPGSKVLLF